MSGMKSGVSLLGLVSGLLDSPTTADLASAIREALAFAQSEHHWHVHVSLVHRDAPLEDPRD